MRQPGLKRLARCRRRRPLSLQIDQLEGRRLLSGSDELREWTGALLQERASGSAEVARAARLETLDQVDDQKQAGVSYGPLHADADEADDRIVAAKASPLPVPRDEPEAADADPPERSPLANSSPGVETAGTVRDETSSSPARTVSSVSAREVSPVNQPGTPNPTGQAVPAGIPAPAAAELTPGVANSSPEPADDPSLQDALRMIRGEQLPPDSPQHELQGEGLIASISQRSLERAIDQVLAGLGDLPELDDLGSPRLIELAPLSLAVAATAGAILVARRLRRSDLDRRETRRSTYPELGFLAIPRRP